MRKLHKDLEDEFPVLPSSPKPHVDSSKRSRSPNRRDLPGGGGSRSPVRSPIRSPVRSPARSPERQQSQPVTTPVTTPTRSTPRPRTTLDAQSPSRTLGSPSRGGPSHASPSSSPRRKTYTDRYIPSRTGVNLQAAFSLLHNDPVPSPSSRPQEIEHQKQQEANQTFSQLLKAELFGDDVPNVIPSPISDRNQSAQTGNNAQQHNNSNDDAGSSENEPMGFHGSNQNANSEIFPQRTPFDLNSLPSGNTPPRNSTSRSVPTTPTRNLFSYRSSIDRLTSGGSGRKAALDSLYSLSPVRPESQQLLLSPRKSPRPVAKIPYKVLDAPELADDFYLNLLDWGSNNVLGVGLNACVYLWQARTGGVSKLLDLSQDGDKVTSLQWITRGNHLAVGTERGLVQIWDAEHNKKVRTMSGHQLRVGCLAWKDHILSSGSRDRCIAHRDVRVADHYVEKFYAHRQEVCGLKWSFDDNQLASGGNDNKLVVWDGISDKPIYRYSDHEAAVKAIAWSPHQRGLLASGGGTADKRIRFWNTTTGALLNEIDTGSQVCNLMWSKNSNEVVSTHGYSQNQIIIWKYPSMQQVAQLKGHTYRVLYLSMNPDGRTIVTGAGDETLRFWNAFNKNPTDDQGSSGVLDMYQHLR
ncbi:Fizzy-related protein-like protein [Yarrowia sp. B02]|nr:Fizzy-related protein-like protein [Yarrowia sp. B02]